MALYQPIFEHPFLREDKISNLENLGFTREQAISGLSRSKGDVQRAASILFTKEIQQAQKWSSHQPVEEEVWKEGFDFKELSDRLRVHSAPTSTNQTKRSRAESRQEGEPHHPSVRKPGRTTRPDPSAPPQDMSLKFYRTDPESPRKAPSRLVIRKKSSNDLMSYSSSTSLAGGGERSPRQSQRQTQQHPKTSRHPTAPHVPSAPPPPSSAQQQQRRQKVPNRSGFWHCGGDQEVQPEQPPNRQRQQQRPSIKDHVGQSQKILSLKVQPTKTGMTGAFMNQPMTPAPIGAKRLHGNPTLDSLHPKFGKWIEEARSRGSWTGGAKKHKLLKYGDWTLLFMDDKSFSGCLIDWFYTP